jgi:hypothetical protein
MNNSKSKQDTKQFDVLTFDVKKYNEILDRGLSMGMGNPESNVCIEAAICQVLNLPHGDDPGCVINSARQFNLRLNDSNWSSLQARAKGLHDLGLAQLGSLGVVNDVEFSKKISEKTIRILIPKLFREIFKNNEECLVAADRCEREGTYAAANAARYTAAAAAAARYTAATDEYSILSANLALEVLRELKSPGCILLR